MSKDPVVEEQTEDYNTPFKKLEHVIAKMALTENFWGYLFGRIGKVKEPNLPSIMGVGLQKNNSVSLFFNPELVKGTDKKTIELVLEHEGLHLLNLHISRGLRLLSVEVDDEVKNRKKMIWNFATDCAVNTQMGMPEKVTLNGKECSVQHPKNYNLPTDRSSESYFHSLLKQNEEQCVMCGSSGNDSGDEQNEDESQQSEQNENNNSDESGNGSGGKVTVKSKCPCCGKETTVGEGTIDDHGNWNSDNQESNNPDDIARKVEDQVKDLVRKSVKSFESSNRRGNVPGYIRELIDDLLTIPKVPYYQMIRSLVKGSRLSKWKKAYTRINKKRVYTFFNTEQQYIVPLISPFPGRTKDFTFNIVILIDTSGSQSVEDIAEALSGIKDIIENDKHCKVTAIEIDTQINKEYEVKKVSDIDCEISGRGGTVLRQGILRAKELNPDIMLGFTDGYCDDVNSFPDTELPKKNVWCISPNGSSERLNKTGPVVFLDD